MSKVRVIDKYDFYRKEVIYGWGEDGIAVSFPVKLAEDCMEALESGDYNEEMADTRIAFVHDMCLDVINNSKDGFDTYIISFHWGHIMKIIEDQLLQKNYESLQAVNYNS